MPTGSITNEPSGTSACLRLAARTASKSQWLKRAISGFRIGGDLVLELIVEHELAAAEAGHHLDRHVVRGRAQAAARDDQVHALVGQEAELRLDVLRAVAADRDVRQLDAQLEQAVGQPRPVSVLDASGQHLGAGDDDARARAHCLRD